jgi:CspA family cold shock protein
MQVKRILRRKNKMSEEKVLTGVCVWFDSRKGVGFVAKDDGTGDLFCHWSNIEMDGFKTLKQGQRVSFVLGSNHRGEQAEQIKVLSEPEEQGE